MAEPRFKDTLPRLPRPVSWTRLLISWWVPWSRLNRKIGSWIPSKETLITEYILKALTCHPLLRRWINIWCDRKLIKKISHHSLNIKIKDYFANHLFLGAQKLLVLLVDLWCGCIQWIAWGSGVSSFLMDFRFLRFTTKAKYLAMWCIVLVSQCLLRFNYSELENIILSCFFNI